MREFANKSVVSEQDGTAQMWTQMKEACPCTVREVCRESGK